MTDPKDRKDPRTTDQDDTEENLQDEVEETLIEIDEDMRRDRYNFDKDDTDLTSNVPNITTDTRPSKRDQKE